MTQYETFSTTRENIDIIEHYCNGNISKSEFYEWAILTAFELLTKVKLEPMKRKPNRITKNKHKSK